MRLSSSAEGKNQSFHLLKVELATTCAADVELQAVTNCLVFDAPWPRVVGLPIMVVVLSHQGSAGSEVPPFHVLGAASRYFPPSLIPDAELIGVGETWKTMPPPGPVSPTTQVPPFAHVDAARVVVGADVVNVEVVVGFAAKYATAEVRTWADTPVTRTGLTRSIVFEFVWP